MNFPPLTKIRQTFPSAKLDDVAGELRLQLSTCGVNIKPGARIAIAAGSRGITDIVPAVQETVHWVKSQGGQPFIVPAMGSHGGATGKFIFLLHPFRKIIQGRITIHEFSTV